MIISLKKSGVSDWLKDLESRKPLSEEGLASVSFLYFSTCLALMFFKKSGVSDWLNELRSSEDEPSAPFADADDMYSGFSAAFFSDLRTSAEVF
ncbi:MAG: hypothetical protein ACD_47C00663G0001, partial [uncultured bacterium]